MSCKETVCVTGPSGFIGLWVVRGLLERGYHVRAAVSDLGNEKKTEPLVAMDGAKERLTLCEMDLLNYDSVEAAIEGTVGVFHLASPATLAVEDPQEKRGDKAELLEPAIQGTVNVLRAALKANVKRVVLTSSIAAIIPNPNWPANVATDDNCWADVDFCKEKGLWYSVSKILAEKAAWDFAKETGLDVVVIHPGLVVGPMLGPSLNASNAMLLGYLQGGKECYKDLFMGLVHIKDCAEGHILLYENPSASGRHLCVQSTFHFSDLYEVVGKLYPEFTLHRFTEETQPGLLRVKEAPKKLTDLGLTFTSLEETVKDAVSGLQEKGYLKLADPLLYNSV